MRVLEKRERESVCVDAFKAKTARGHQGERERERERGCRRSVTIFVNERVCVHTSPTHLPNKLEITFRYLPTYLGACEEEHRKRERRRYSVWVCKLQDIPKDSKKKWSEAHSSSECNF